MGYLDPKITITVIENGHIVDKIRPKQPQRLINVIKCTNPRCVTSVEEGCDHIFTLTPSGRYRCVYCEQEVPRKTVIPPECRIFPALFFFASFVNLHSIY